MVMTRSMKLKSQIHIPDMISSLPDALLTHILSFLETKESVSTSILSARWRNLFAFVPVLDFVLLDPCPNPEEFVKFVNGMLSLHDVSCTVRFFRIDMGLHPCNGSDVSSWITAAIRRNAEILEVDVNLNGVPCPVPNDLFTSQFLVDLRLCSGFVIDVTCPVSLPRLKTIDISCCKFNNGDSAKRLFSGCPVLEDIRLWCCDSCDGNVISISALSLKRLSIHCWSSGCEWEVNNVPNLDYINFCGAGYTTKCYSVNILKSLRKAKIVVEGEDYEMIGQLVNKFEEVQSLSLLDDCMESLASGSFSLPIFNKLTTLALMVDFSHGWKFFPVLLERSPCLELLIIEGAGFSNCDEEFLEIDILLPTRIPLCFSRSLKEVQLRMLKGVKVEYEWLGYLLKNAIVLESFTVSLVDEDEEDKIRKKLLALPRGSKEFKHLNLF